MTRPDGRPPGDQHRLSDDDLRELARLVRVIHADAAAWRERERQDPSQDDEARCDAGNGDHDAA
jgi:hypothetical protein